MNKFARRVGALFAVLLAAVLGLGTATPAQADTYDHTVTFKGVETGDSLVAYQLIKYADDYNSFGGDEGFRLFCKDYSQEQNLGLDQGADFNALVEWLSKLTSDQTAALLKTYVNRWSAGAGMDGVAKPGEYQTSSAATAGSNPTLHFGPGYYLVMPKTADGSVGSKLYNPLSVFVKVDGSSSTITAGSNQDAKPGDIEVQMKSTTGPSIEKYTVRANGSLHKTRTVSPGETVTFAVRVDFSSYEAGGGLKPVLHDTLKNLEYGSGSTVGVYQVNGDGSIGARIDADGDNTVEVDGGDYAGGTQDIAFALDWDKISNGTQKSVYVVYTATVTDDIVADTDGDGNYVGSNEAYLEYPTTIDGSQKSRTESSTTYVYSYGLKLSKYNNDGDALSGAQFKLTDNTDGNTEVFFKKVGDIYYVVDASGNHDGTTNVLDASSGAKANELDVRGLDCSHEYVLSESGTPKGYYAPSGTWTVKFESMKQNGNAEEHTGNLASASIVGSDDATTALVSSQQAKDATFSVVIKNTTTPSLPTTGGMGTVLFTVAGVALMVVAAAIFFMKRRHN